MEVNEYIKIFREEIKREEAERDRLFEKLNKKARRAAKQLGNKYNVERIYLFGSLVNKDKFRY